MTVSIVKFEQMPKKKIYLNISIFKQVVQKVQKCKERDIMRLFKTKIHYHILLLVEKDLCLKFYESNSLKMTVNFVSETEKWSIFYTVDYKEIKNLIQFQL